jgi:hypothetical protein
MAYPSLSAACSTGHHQPGLSGAASRTEIAALFAEIDPAVYVYDSLPNLPPAEAKDARNFLRTLRQAHPKTPIVLVENAIYTNIQFSEQRRAEVTEKNATLKAVYQKLRKEGDKNLYYVPAAALFGATAGPPSTASIDRPGLPPDGTNGAGPEAAKALTKGRIIR